MPALPAEAVRVQEPGYYDIHVELKLGTRVESPSVWLTLTRGGFESTVWPMSTDPGAWTADFPTDRFSGTAKAIPCQSGDEIRTYIQHSHGSAVNVTGGAFTMELVDRTTEPSTGAQVTSESYTSTVSSTSNAVPLPVSVSGDLLIVGFSTAPAISITFPAGWTVLGSESLSGKLESKWAYRIADGSEGSTVSVTLGSSTWAFGHSVVVSGDTEWAAPDAETTSESIADGAFVPAPGQPPTVTVSSGGSYVVFVSYMSRNIWDLSGPDGWEELEVFNFFGGGHPELAALLSRAESLITSTFTPGTVAGASADPNVRGRTMATIAVKVE